MKQSKLALFSLIAALMSFGAGSAMAGEEITDQIRYSDMAVELATQRAFDVINWKVGDNASYDVTAGSFGKMGTMEKSVSKDEGTALWLHQEIKLQGQNDVVDTLISKADAKVLKMIHNGKEEAVPNDKVEIISQDYSSVTVPAGTFECLYVVAKTAKVKKIEVWVNPRDTVMEGTLKQTAQTSFMPVTIELTRFQRAN